MLPSLKTPDGTSIGPLADPSRMGLPSSHGIVGQALLGSTKLNQISGANVAADAQQFHSSVAEFDRQATRMKDLAEAYILGVVTKRIDPIEAIFPSAVPTPVYHASMSEAVNGLNLTIFREINSSTFL